MPKSLKWNLGAEKVTVEDISTLLEHWMQSQELTALPKKYHFVNKCLFMSDLTKHQLNLMVLATLLRLLGPLIASKQNNCASSQQERASLAISMKQTYMELYYKGVINKQNQFELLVLLIVEVAAEFLEESVNNLLVNDSLRGECCIVVMHAFLGKMVSQKTYVALQRKYVNMVPQPDDPLKALVPPSQLLEILNKQKPQNGKSPTQKAAQQKRLNACFELISSKEIACKQPNASAVCKTGRMSVQPKTKRNLDLITLKNISQDHKGSSNISKATNGRASILETPRLQPRQNPNQTRMMFAQQLSKNLRVEPLPIISMPRRRLNELISQYRANFDDEVSLISIQHASNRSSNKLKYRNKCSINAAQYALSSVRLPIPRSPLESYHCRHNFKLDQVQVSSSMQFQLSLANNLPQSDQMSSTKDNSTVEGKFRRLIHLKTMFKNYQIVSRSSDGIMCPQGSINGIVNTSEGSQTLRVDEIKQKKGCIKKKSHQLQASDPQRYLSTSEWTTSRNDMGGYNSPMTLHIRDQNSQQSKQNKQLLKSVIGCNTTHQCNGISKRTSKQDNYSKQKSNQNYSNSNNGSNKDSYKLIKSVKYIQK